nr:hypothetical protein [Tanacetum cinerariifolium]
MTLPKTLGGHTSDRAEGALNLEELFSICTNLSNRVLALETIKDAHAAKIIALKARIKKLEKKCKPSISHHRAWLKSVQMLSIKKRFGTKGSIKEEKAKEKGVSIKDIKDSLRPARSILTLKPLPTIDPKYKGKCVLEEPKPAKKMTISDLDAAKISKDAKIYSMEGSDDEISPPPPPQTPTQQAPHTVSTIKLPIMKKVQSTQSPSRVTKALCSSYFPELSSPKQTVFGKDISNSLIVDSSLKTIWLLVHYFQMKKEKLSMKFLTRDFQSLTRSQNSITLTYMEQSVSTIEYSDLMEVLDGSKLFLKWTMFKETADDDLWKNQEELIPKSWNFYENYRVHTLTFKDGTEIYILAESKRLL